MTTYDQKVKEARGLVRRSEEDQWRLAELSWRAVHEDGKTQTEWAGDVGATQGYVSRVVKIWAHYDQVIIQDRPKFADAYAEAKGLPVDRKERREMEAVSNIRGDVVWTVGTYETGFEFMPTTSLRDAAPGIINQMKHAQTRDETIRKTLETLATVDPDPGFSRMAQVGARYFTRRIQAIDDYRDDLEYQLNTASSA